jgi:hypothetical protein
LKTAAFAIPRDVSRVADGAFGAAICRLTLPAIPHGKPDFIGLQMLTLKI